MVISIAKDHTSSGHNWEGFLAGGIGTLMYFRQELSDLEVHARLGRPYESAVGEESILIINFVHKQMVNELGCKYVLDDNYGTPASRGILVDELYGHLSDIISEFFHCLRLCLVPLYATKVAGLEVSDIWGGSLAGRYACAACLRWHASGVNLLCGGHS